jgi:hypothetical protein
LLNRGTHHPRGTAEVVDPDQGQIVGDISDAQGVQGIAVADEFNKGYTDDMSAAGNEDAMSGRINFVISAAGSAEFNSNEMAAGAAGRLKIRQ